MLPHRFAALMLPLALLTMATAAASAHERRPAGRQWVDMRVVDRDAAMWRGEATLDHHWYRGRTWIAGEPGHRYSVRLTNTTGEHVLVVLSVDGVNAVSGETADPLQAGYVLGPWQTTEVHGWRKSLDDVAQFVFTDLPDSYAARTGRPDNVGVIGIAVFREAPVYRGEVAVAQHERRKASERSAAAPASAPADAAAAGSAAEVAPQRLGTGHGDREWSPVSRTTFVRHSRTPAQVTEIRYDDLDTLIARGVVRRPVHPWHRDEPRAFPEGFVADPPR